MPSQCKAGDTHYFMNRTTQRQHAQTCLRRRDEVTRELTKTRSGGIDIMYLDERVLRQLQAQSEKPV